MMTPEETAQHRHFMAMALKQAEQALAEDEIPIGAIVVCHNTIIGRGYNQTEKLHDATAHAEMIAITAAANYLNSKYLRECTLYVTLEPCVMCAGAAKWSQIGHLVYGAADPKGGFACVHQNILHPKTTIVDAIESEKCGELLTQFFKGKRK